MGKREFWNFSRRRVVGHKTSFYVGGAKQAERVQFHPSQKMSKGRGGSTIIELRCRGHRELIHELCHPDWVGLLAIEKPDEFRTKFFEYLDECAKAMA